MLTADLPSKAALLIHTIMSKDYCPPICQLQFSHDLLPKLPTIPAPEGVSADQTFLFCQQVVRL